jgi:hypothetical protein
MWPGMKNLPAVAVVFPLASFLLAGCASTPPPSSAPTVSGFAKAAAFELAPDDAGVGPAASATEDGIEVASADGSRTRTLRSGLDRTGFALVTSARGLASEPGAFAWEFLATLSNDPAADLAVLSIHDAGGDLVHEEVLPEACTGLAWQPGDTAELRVECHGRVWSYSPGSGGAPALSGEQFAHAGAVGPLRFGDDVARARTALQLAGASCQTESCTLWTLPMDGRSYVVAPGYDAGRLARITVFGTRRGRAEWRTKVRHDWTALTEELTRGAGMESVSFPPLRALKASAKLDGWLLTETHHVRRADMQATVGLYGDSDGKTVGAIAVLTPASAGGALPASAAD